MQRWLKHIVEDKDGQWGAVILTVGTCIAIYIMALIYSWVESL